MTEGFDGSGPGTAAARRSAEALRAARSTWSGATRDGAGACGMDVVERAYTEMREAWFGEIGVHIAVLDQAGGAGDECTGDTHGQGRG